MLVIVLVLAFTTFIRACKHSTARIRERSSDKSLLFVVLLFCSFRTATLSPTCTTPRLQIKAWAVSLPVLSLAAFSRTRFLRMHETAECRMQNAECRMHAPTDPIQQADCPPRRTVARDRQIIYLFSPQKYFDTIAKSDSCWFLEVVVPADCSRYRE